MVMYDGYCNLCSRTVQWILKYDRQKEFSFIPLQQTEYEGLDYSNSDTVLLLMNGKIYNRSGAVLQIAMRLKFPWPLLGIFIIIPPFVRNGVYNLISRNRKKWFGSRTTCYLP